MDKSKIIKNFWYRFPLFASLLLLLVLGVSTTSIILSLFKSFRQNALQTAKIISENYRNEILSGQHRNLLERIQDRQDIQKFDLLDTHCRSMIQTNVQYLNCQQASKKNFILYHPIYFDAQSKEVAAILYFEFSKGTLQQQVVLAVVMAFSLASLTLIFLFIVYRTHLNSLGAIANKTVKALQSAAPDSPQDLTEIRQQFPLQMSPIFDETVRLAAKLKETAAKLQKAEVEATLGRVALQVAHDIRSPLSSMQTALEFLKQKESKDKKETDIFNLLELSSKRLTAIANDLLTKHKGRSQKMVFSLYKVLDELVGEYEEQEPYKEVRFIKEYSSQAIQLVGDSAKLQRAFGNIVKNGIEAMGFKGVVTIRAEEEKGSSVIISIQDTGPGMSEETLLKVLQGGFTEGKKGGHGIGTKVVRETIGEFGGRLTAQSKIGEGSTFHIELPIPNSLDLRGIPQETLSIKTFELKLDHREPVVVIEDEASMREQWRLILEEHHQETILCDSYEDFEKKRITTDQTKRAIVDYHFANSTYTGADIVALLLKKGFTNITLCTAEYWKPSVQKLAQELQVKLCPKPLPKIIVSRKVEEDSVEEVDGYRVLVIDDEEGVRLSWEMKQNKLKIKELHCYANLEEVMGNGLDPNLIDIAFIDKNIERSKYTGADTISELRKLGIQKIVLASGEDEETLRQDPAFKDIHHITETKIPKNLKVFF